MQIKIVYFTFWLFMQLSFVWVGGGHAQSGNLPHEEVEKETA